jgi:hypothetical protein
MQQVSELTPDVFAYAQNHRITSKKGPSSLILQKQILKFDMYVYTTQSSLQTYGTL